VSTLSFEVAMSLLSFENLYFTIVGSIQYKQAKQYNNRLREEKKQLIYKKINYRTLNTNTSHSYCTINYTLIYHTTTTVNYSVYIAVC